MTKPIFIKMKPRSKGYSYMFITKPVIGVDYCNGMTKMFDKPISFIDFNIKYGDNER